MLGALGRGAACRHGGSVRFEIKEKCQEKQQQQQNKQITIFYKGQICVCDITAIQVCWWRCKIETIEIDDEDGGGRFAGNSGRQQGGFGGVNADRLASPHLTLIFPHD
uniref:Tify domain-containing protein n=1 Tax=Ananas comosus var. bracteatus TaxID=296719 RepID=A0A6V7NNS4_ANACO|nr:unnamed protein product [Ananas comosus var. bracteatus]